MNRKLTDRTANAINLLLSTTVKCRTVVIDGYLKKKLDEDLKSAVLISEVAEVEGRDKTIHILAIPLPELDNMDLVDRKFEVYLTKNSDIQKAVNTDFERVGEVDFNELINDFVYKFDHLYKDPNLFNSIKDPNLGDGELVEKGWIDKLHSFMEFIKDFESVESFEGFQELRSGVQWLKDYRDQEIN